MAATGRRDVRGKDAHEVLFLDGAAAVFGELVDKVVRQLLHVALERRGDGVVGTVGHAERRARFKEALGPRHWQRRVVRLFAAPEG